MDSQLKNILGSILIGVAVLIALSSLVVAYTYSQSVDPTGMRSFSVTGTGEAFVVPNIAVFSFGLISQGANDLASLEAQNSTQINKIVSFLKEAGISDSDIQTANYNVNPRYQYSDCRSGICPPPQIVGYEISQRLTVKVRDISIAGSLLSGVVKRGANDVSGLNLVVDDPLMVKNEARSKAITQAQAEAKALAKAGGFRIGKLISIDEANYGGMPISHKFGLGGAEDMVMAVNQSESRIEAGQNKVTIQMVLRYEIK